MKKFSTAIHDAWVLRPEVLRDERGFLAESWNKMSYAALGLDFEFVQENHSRSVRGVLRGLHYQAGAAAQGKLVTVTRGTAFDVLVDLRRSSPSFGAWSGHWLDAETPGQLWVPPGCAHGFLAVADSVDVVYKMTAPREAAAERALLWNDEDLGIEWPLGPGEQPILSPRDLAAPGFKECEKYD